MHIEQKEYSCGAEALPAPHSAIHLIVFVFAQHHRRAQTGEQAGQARHLLARRILITYWAVFLALLASTVRATAALAISIANRIGPGAACEAALRACTCMPVCWACV